MSAAALGVPVAATLLFNGDFGDQQPLLWLLALVPAFLLAYYHGWRGAAVALAGGMAALAATHAGALWLGNPLPDSPLALAIIPVFLGVCLGIGWTTELLHRRFALLQEAAGELTLAVSASGIIHQASGSATKILGFQPRQLEGTRIERLLEPAAPTEFLARLGSLPEGESLEFNIRRADGAVRVLDMLVQARRGGPGVGGYVLRARDVTDRRVAEEQARRVFRMQAISALVGPVAHDLNNALTIIQGNADLLAEDLYGNAAAAQCLQPIQAAAGRAGRMVEMLLAFTRQQVLRPKPLALATVLNEVRSRIEDVLGPGIAAELRVAEDAPQVYFDAVRLRQILLLLAARAREVMPAGGRLTLEAGRAEITAEQASVFPYEVIPGDYALLVVSDSGPHLPEAEIASLFDPFAMSLGADATGLELSSVYGTIKQAGGYVWVESGADGSAFRMYLPVAADPLPLLSLAAPEEKGVITVLLVEDDPAVRAVVSQSLLRRGHCVIEAQDGEEALALVEQRGSRPDVLVTDLLMPRLGGRALAEEMTRRFGPFPVLYISGYTHDAVLAESLLRPGETLLSKPFTAQQLADTLRDVLEGVTHT